jgi:opacity protein-like surface antigen
MKKMPNSLPRTAGVCTGLAAALALSASAADTGLYFNAEGGVNFAQDVVVGGRTFELDPGFRADVGVGYNFSKYLGVEFDTGWIWNHFQDIDGLTGDINLSHLPFILNAVFRYENSSKFVPYIGAGAGGTYTFLDFNTNGVNDSDGDVVFAWQALAGVRYLFTDNLSIGAGYRYHGTTEGTYNITGVQNGRDFNVSNVHNHSFSIVFNMTF